MITLQVRCECDLPHARYCTDQDGCCEQDELCRCKDWNKVEINKEKSGFEIALDIINLK